VPMHIEDVACIQTSFPNFTELLAHIGTLRYGD